MFFYLISGLSRAGDRHRHFPPSPVDIDILIRRTLVYSILTVILTLVYFGTVVLLQALFTIVIGHQTPAAIVLSTLAIAAIFSYLRRHIQAFIDRRFYRRKYNTERVLADFGHILRERVDLEALTESILEVVVETMQPENVSIWLPEVDRRPGDGEQKKIPVSYPASSLDAHQCWSSITVEVFPQVPHPEGAIESGRIACQAIRAESYIPYYTGMPAEISQLITGIEVPQPDRLVSRAGKGIPAVWAESDGVDH